MSDDGACSIPPQTFVQCGICEGHINISWFCKNCPFSLCDACATSHNLTKQYKFHTVVQRTYTVLRLFGPAKIAEQCPYHPEKDISLYCNECEVSCCTSCFVEMHQRHEISNIEDKYLDAEKRLMDYLTKRNDEVIPMLNQTEGITKTGVLEENDLVEIVINDINEFRRTAIQNIYKSCDNLNTELKSLFSKCSEGLKEIENSKKKIESLKGEIDEKFKRGDLDIIKYKTLKLEHLVPTPKSPPNVVPIFEPVMRVLDVSKESVGKIQIKEMNKKQRDHYKILRSLHVQKQNSFRSIIAVTSMTRAGNNTAWIVKCYSPTMYLYNDKGEVVRSMTVKGCQSIRDMATTQSGEMIITCKDKKVRLVTADGEVSTLIDTSPFSCEGVDVTDKQDILVSMNGQCNKNHVADGLI